MQRRRYPRALALAALATAVAAATTSAAPTAIAEAPSAAETRLSATIDAILADARLDGAQAGVVVADATTGDTLYQRNGDRRLIPASNTKLLTSAAAMELLGPGHRFTTDVLRTGAKQGTVLTGDLHLRGGGDPTMLAADYDALAARVATAGIRVVTGDLIADDTRYDATRLGPDWAWDDEPYYYAAQISALTVAPDTDYDAGTVIVGAAPGATAGARPEISFTPSTGYLRVDNRATTVATGSTSISFEREHATNTIVVTGQIALGAARTSDWVSVWEPTGYAADVFRTALSRHGVRVLGETVPGRATPPSAVGVTSHDSMPLSELMVPFMKLSNNGHAEVLTKEIGRVLSGSGTWSAGLAKIRQYVATAGMDTGTLNQRDGSGLSRRNMIPADEFVDLLVAVRGEPWFDAWYAALPVAGNAERFVGGTLRSRMRGTPAANNVRAKTGSLTGVSGLSGYVTDADGRQLVFSIVLNNYLASSVKNLEDQIAVALASYTGKSVTTARTAPPAAPEIPQTPDGIECSWQKPITC
ncbi:D-alanyl-D-alanine carboxypeptidase / D-alanyl-D-alanine-endopeptidase (penicillin-binding protein 4) [Micromonospora pallida]|uniref:D-alanyl-D-alanine carboxypeptidase / D-alanyl-D-alanine-endopeptidase (Penicillin-binding protein 4) n=1 Tax=Micromonospora pallida TaxID=145854 RepID=A0A1C6SZU1_9ACTN|nr:D-alanyl-D-alanine carboxypeptidase/D-alanyl-D-alanine-endopeptidase [Micromonospora pallida]SCL34783.1 D-alanyl-D-alanine carboxypeptidase / D-alanyl-D-alanine-endopeptidase (penicillin-binding protein 4) [Micromonospora pallida]